MTLLAATSESVGRPTTRCLPPEQQPARQDRLAGKGNRQGDLPSSQSENGGEP